MPSATVNGYPVPCVIPASQILIYFPHGILGLQRVAAPGNASPASPTGDLTFDNPVCYEPVALTADGTLRLDANTDYFLPSAQGAGLNGRQIETAVDRAVSRMGHHVSTRVSDMLADNTALGPLGTVGAMMTRDVPMSSFERHNRRHSRHPSSFAEHESVRRADSYHQANDGDYRDGHHAEEHSDHGGESHEPHPDGSGGEQLPAPAALSRSVLFDRAHDLVPKDTSKEEAERFQAHRRRALVIYGSAHLFMLLTWSVAIGLDRWHLCDCSTLGLWRVCADCSANATMRPLEPRRYKTIEFDGCIATSNFAGCDGPNVATARNMVVVSTVMVASNVVVIVVDFLCHITPRRPFYPFYFLVIWSMTFASWMIMAVGANSPAKWNLSQIACEVQSNVAGKFLDALGILVYHPLDTTRQSEQSLDELGVQGTTTVNFAANCRMGWSLGLTALPWVVYTLISAFYFYSRYSAWNDLTHKRVQSSGLTHSHGHSLDAPALDSTEGRMAMVRRIRRRQSQHNSPNQPEPSGNLASTASEMQRTDTLDGTAIDLRGDTMRAFESFESVETNLVSVIPPLQHAGGPLPDGRLESAAQSPTPSQGAESVGHRRPLISPSRD
jgi:hypothetical protein